MLTVFYGEQVWGTFKSWAEFKHTETPLEVYNGCYVYMSNDGLNRHWYRGDITPCLIEDVPTVLRTMVLLME